MFKLFAKPELYEKIVAKMAVNSGVYFNIN